MPAPEDLTVQTPGEPLAPAAPAADTATTEEQPPLYKGKHSAGGRYWIVTNDAAETRVGTFVGNKETIDAEVARVNAGGEIFNEEPTKATKPAAKTAAAAPAAKPAQAIDPTTLKQPVLTADGWLCPEPKGA